MNNYKFKIGEKIKAFNRIGIVLDLFKGTEREGFWIKVLYEKTDYEDVDFECVELIKSIKPLIETINIII